MVDPKVVEQVSFKPSEVVLTTPCPLTDCFGKTEREQAAFMLVRALAENGDEWRAITNVEVFATFKRDVEAKREPAIDLCQNPFFRPDVFGLVAMGCVVQVGENGPTMTSAFTPEGIARMSKWVRRKS